jgi:hypothetical protein
MSLEERDVKGIRDSMSVLYVENCPSKPLMK